MKNNNNIYDIDGNLIRSIKDEHKWTVQEVKDKIEYYRKKLTELAEKDPKAVVYSTYMRNLYNYLFVLYSQMPAESLQAEIDKAKAATTNEQIRKAMEDLQNEVKNEQNDGITTKNTEEQVPESGNATDNKSNANEEPGNDVSVKRDDSNVHEEGTKSQSDLLVERGDVTTSMDEYVDYEEV